MSTPPPVIDLGEARRAREERDEANKDQYLLDCAVTGAAALKLAAETSPEVREALDGCFTTRSVEASWALIRAQLRLMAEQCPAELVPEWVWRALEDPKPAEVVVLSRPERTAEEGSR
jgi:hypothetical protein